MLNSRTCLVTLSALLISFAALAQSMNPESGNANHVPLGNTQLNAAAVAAGMPKTDSMPEDCRCKDFIQGNRLNSSSLENKATTAMCPTNVPVETLSDICRLQLAKTTTAPTVKGGAINEGNKNP